ncbi:MAG: GNAT family N-acetyltransferase [Clostridia bacterium]|nr:GNAT family N-acetyltransferase [Clostridia bacterium]
MNIALVKANENDAETIWKMQKAAFVELLNKYKDFDTNPASEPLEKVLIRLKQPYTYYYFIKLNNENIGAIRVVDKKSEMEKKRISPLFILPDFRNKGYAQQSILQVEKIHGDYGWELETILQEKGNCHLYEKSGYQRTDKFKIINPLMTLVNYQK